MATSPHLYLGAAILAEVTATSALKSADGFTRLWPSLIVVAGYGLSFFLLSLTLRAIPIGVVYAIWSGAGIVLIATVGWLLFKQTLDTPALVGMGMIIAGVAVINLLSKTAGH